MNRRVRVKICGITRPEDGVMAAHAGADAIGLVFVASSPRHVPVAAAGTIAHALPPFVSRVGVFVNPTRREVEDAISAAGLHLLQFHGDEPAAFCSAFQVPYCKAVRVSAAGDAERVARAHPAAVAILLDSHVEGSYGGTGCTFPWQFAAAPLGRPIILAGGLNGQNVGNAIAAVAPFAVDVSGGVESAPGIKDPARVRDFIAAVLGAGQALPNGAPELG